MLYSSSKAPHFTKGITKWGYREGKALKILVGNVNCEIQDISKLELDRISKALNCFAPNYKFTHLYKRNLWDGRVSLLNGNSFPTGLLSEVVKHCKEIQIVDQRNIRPLNGNFKTTIPLRSYQLDAINKALNNTYLGMKWPRGVIKICCGGGKTFTAAAIAQVTNVITLFVVDRQELLRQAVDAFSQFNIDVGTSIENPKRVTVTTIQSLMKFSHVTNEKTASGNVRSEKEINRISANKKQKELQVIQYLNTVEQVFMDEAHGVAGTIENGNMMFKALALMPNAYMRWGLTATPFERDDYSNLLLEGATGSTVVEIGAKKLIELGYLSAPTINFFKMKNTIDIPEGWPECYNYGIVLNDKRNDKIVQEAIKAQKPCIVLVSSVQHGILLSEKFKQLNHTVPFLSGQDDKEYRQDIQSQVKDGTVPIVIASKIWNTGVDMPNVRTIILAAAGSSVSNIRQIIGRGMRVTPDKKTFNFIDFIDNKSKTLREHSRIRRMVLMQEGYTVNEVAL